MELTRRMIAYVQCLLAEAKPLHSDCLQRSIVRLERIEAYLIRRYNREN